MLKRALITLGIAAVVVTAGAGVANAQGTNVSPLLPASTQSADAHTRYNHPDVDPAKQAVRCTADQYLVGSTCFAKPHHASERNDTLGSYGVAGLGLFALFALL